MRTCAVHSVAACAYETALPSTPEESVSGVSADEELLALDEHTEPAHTLVAVTSQQRIAAVFSGPEHVAPLCKNGFIGFIGGLAENSHVARPAF